MNLPLISFITHIFLFLHITARRWRTNSFCLLICDLQLWNRPSPVPTAGSLVSTMFLPLLLSYRYLKNTKVPFFFLLWGYSHIRVCTHTHTKPPLDAPGKGLSWELSYQPLVMTLISDILQWVSQSLVLIAKHVTQMNVTNPMSVQWHLEKSCWTPNVNIAQLYIVSNCNDTQKSQSIRLILLLYKQIMC